MVKTILIANTAEAFQEILVKDDNTRIGKDRISHELTLSQRAFFWEGDHKVVITPYLIPSVLMEVNRKALELNSVANLTPTNGGINLCSLVMEDEGLMRTVADQIKGHPNVVVSPYAVTTDFLRLVTKLKGMGLDFAVPEKPADKSLWTTAYLDSKAGFRAEMLKLARDYENVKVPEGFVAMDAAEALRMAEWFYIAGRSSVMKSNFGESGWGVKILRKKEYATLSVFRKAVVRIFDKDVIWQDTRIVVEEFVEADIEVAGGSPSTEMLVNDSGASFTYHCGQTLNKAGAFSGVEIGKDALSESLSEKLLAVANPIGRKYWELGYRGYFDIDFIVSKNGEIYVAETNTRRTGGTHVYDTAKFLFGERYGEQVYLLSQDSLVYSKKKMRPQDLLKRLGRVLYPVNGHKTGVIVTMVSEWNPVMGYIVIAPNRFEGQKLQRQLLSLFGK